MKKSMLICILLIQVLLGEIPMISSDNIQELMNNEKKIVTIYGKVISTGLSANQTVRYLNFSKDYRTGFSVVIFGRHYKHFEKENIEPTTDYMNKTLSVTGRIKIYEGKPEIIVAKPSQIIIKE